MNDTSISGGKGRPGRLVRKPIHTCQVIGGKIGKISGMYSISFRGKYVDIVRFQSCLLGSVSDGVNSKANKICCELNNELVGGLIQYFFMFIPKDWRK